MDECDGALRERCRHRVAEAESHNAANCGRSGTVVETCERLVRSKRAVSEQLQSSKHRHEEDHRHDPEDGHTASPHSAQPLETVHSSKSACHDHQVYQHWKPKKVVRPDAE